jgi:hypothetical protein
VWPSPARWAGPRRHALVLECAAVDQELDSGQPSLLARRSASGVSGQGSSRGRLESRSGCIRRRLGGGMADNDRGAAVISRQAIAGVPMTPASARVRAPARPAVALGPGPQVYLGLARRHRLAVCPAWANGFSVTSTGEPGPGKNVMDQTREAAMNTEITGLTRWSGRGRAVPGGNPGTGPMVLGAGPGLPAPSAVAIGSVASAGSRGAGKVPPRWGHSSLPVKEAHDVVRAL